MAAKKGLAPFKVARRATSPWKCVLTDDLVDCGGPFDLIVVSRAAYIHALKARFLRVPDESWCEADTPSSAVQRAAHASTSAVSWAGAIRSSTNVFQS